MGIRLRKSGRLFGLPLIRWNLSDRGVSFTFKLGPWSWNTRSQRSRVDLPGPWSWTGRRRQRGGAHRP